LASAIPLVPAQQAQEVAPKRVNLNTATVEELKQLPGIGPSLAQRIVAHREKNGRFRRIEELLIVRGINRKKFEALRSLIYVEKPPTPGSQREKPG
ncbi:MAG: helix-hairpin-helix domain-containing protein, partial [Acidobacteria bacterium]|nr:helix-hairpin-helix domain-containing protein [Acidobacteriota bacterium]